MRKKTRTFKGEPRHFLGAMTTNVLKALCEWSNEHNRTIGVIPSRRQIDFNGGYTGWRTGGFADYMKAIGPGVILERDHGGPNQGDLLDDGVISLMHDCEHMDIIHIDPWKTVKTLNQGVEKTADLIQRCYKKNPRVLFEVGTEESIFPYEAVDLDYMLTHLRRMLPSPAWLNIEYAVVQSGTTLKDGVNTGVYNESRLKDMLKVVKHHQIFAKEHNGDFLPAELIRYKINAGLDAINIAPEFGQVETRAVMEAIDKCTNFISLFNDFYDECYASNRWQKWFADGFDPAKHKLDFIFLCGHYVMRTPTLARIKEEIGITRREIINKIKGKINDIGI